MDFVIPARPEDLEGVEAGSEGLTVTELFDVQKLAPGQLLEFTEGLTFVLCEETLSVAEQSSFDKLYSLARDFKVLPGAAKTILLDCLCANLSVLVASSSSLLAAANSDAISSETATAFSSHLNALKLYAFFLQWICSTCEKESRIDPGVDKATTNAGPKGPKGKGKQKSCGASTWDWENEREKLLRPLAIALDLDLKRLYRGRQPEDGFLNMFIRTALLCMEGTTALKNKQVKGHIVHILGTCAMKHQQILPVVSGLTDLLNKYEHLPNAIVELAYATSVRFGDSQLVVMLLREVASEDPAHYKAQQEKDSLGVRNVATFLEVLSNTLPKVVATNISLLMPHLNGEAYMLRSALVTVLGNLLVGAFEDKDNGNSGAVEAQLRTKQAMLDTLIERTRDVSAYTRGRVMQAWRHVCQEKALPLGHWMCVTELAIGRLQDKASLVRKSAFQLLVSLLHYNPFADQLTSDKFAASLKEYTDKLNHEEEAAKPKDESEDGAEWATENNVEVAAEDAVDDGQDAETPLADGGEDSPSQEDDEAGAGQGKEELVQLDGGLQALRALVASLSIATNFSEALHLALPTACELLVSKNVTDVVEAVTFVVEAHKFRVTGSAAAVGRMLALIFSREAAVREATLDAALTLYIESADPHISAQRLVGAAATADLGTLAALEEILVQMVHKQVLPAKGPVVRRLWSIVAGDTAAEDPAARRGAMAVLSMAAAAQPQVVHLYLQVLVERVFQGSGAGDALLLRYACTALQRLVPAGERTAGGAGLPPDHAVWRALQALVAASRLPDEGWFTAAEAAIGAVFAAHPDPEALVAAALHSLKARALPAGGEGQADADGADGDEAWMGDGGGLRASESDLARFMFVLGQVALKQLVYSEALVKGVRRKRLEAERAAAAADQTGPGAAEEEEGIEAAVGQGTTAAEEAQLDALKEQVERELLSAGGGSPVGAHVGLVVSICRTPQALRDHPTLRSAALLTLTKFMAISEPFCDAHLQLLFTVLRDAHAWAPSVRSNLIIALGDLAFRWPNSLEPWTEHIYGSRVSRTCLHDPAPSVRQDALLVLTHLILNDMMKVKGYISEMVLMTQDAEPRIRDLAHLFVHELKRKPGNPVYNLLPDLLSRLSSDPELSMDCFCRIMGCLLSDRHAESSLSDKQAESLIDRFLGRFNGVDEARQWQCIAFCITSLNVTDKAMRRLNDTFKAFSHTLADTEVAEMFLAMCARTKKALKPDAPLRTATEALEQKIAEVRLEPPEEEAAPEAAAGDSSREAPAESGMDCAVDGEAASDGDRAEVRDGADDNSGEDEPDVNKSDDSNGRTAQEAPVKAGGENAVGRGKGRAAKAPESRASTRALKVSNK